MGKGSSSNNKRLIFLVFSFFLIVNLTSSGGHFDLADGLETFLVIESMVLKHSAMLHPDIPTVKNLDLYDFLRGSFRTYHYFQTGILKSPELTPLYPIYTKSVLLLSAIAVPLYYAASVFSVPPIPIVGLFVNSLIISLTAVVIFCFSLEIYGSKRIPFILSLIFGVSSFVWPYNTSLLPQPLQALLIIASAFFIYISARPNNDSNNNRIYFAALGGLFLGFSIFAHPVSAILIPGIIVYAIFLMRRNKKSLSSFLVVLFIILFFAGLTNYWRFGSFTDFGYGIYGSLSIHNGREGLVGLLASPGVGLIFFFPITILVPIAFKFMYRENKALFFLSAYVIIATWLYFGTLSDTHFFNTDPGIWNGLAWGPRYLIVALPFITLVSGTLLVHLKKLRLKARLFLKLSIVVLCIAGFYVNLLGKLVWYGYGYGYGWEKEVLWINEAKKPNSSYVTMTWNPYYSPIILHTKVLRDDYVAHRQANNREGLAPCSYDIYLYCKLGIVPILLSSAVIGILALLIIMEISRFNPKLFNFRLKKNAT